MLEAVAPAVKIEVTQRRFDVRQGDAFIKLAVDLAIQSPHGPSAPGSLGLAEGADLRVFRRQQAHVGRAGQRKGLGECRGLRMFQTLSRETRNPPVPQARIEHGLAQARIDRPHDETHHTGRGV